MMTCLETGCGGEPVVLPDPVTFRTSTFTIGGNPSNILCIDNNPQGESATPWCESHFPRWMRNNQRARSGTAKPHIRMTAAAYLQMAAQMREVNAAINTIGDAARSGAVAIERMTEAAEIGESA